MVIMKNYLFKKKTFFKKLTLVFAAFFLLSFTGSYAVTVDSQNEDELHLIKGDLETIKVFDLTRLSVTNPDVADIANVDNDHILMLAKQSGQTTLFIWDKYGKRSLIIRVSDDNLDLVKSRLQELLTEAKIKGVSLEVNKLESKIMISGTLTKDQMTELKKLTEPFGASLMDMTKEKVENELIQIDAQIAELNASYSKTLGFNWTSALTYSETLPAFNPKTPTDFLKIGDFARTTQILAKIDALITEGKGRVISRPKLVCVSGKEASFLVGGQIPITTTTTSSGGSTQENVEFRDYGVTLKVGPTIKEDKIDITLDITISDIDASNKVGNNVAFTTRNTQTQLSLNDRQTIVLAGLIKHNEGESVKRIPFLSDIPILGAVFRHRETPTATVDTELVISLTPTILADKKTTTATEIKMASTGEDHAPQQTMAPVPIDNPDKMQSVIAGSPMVAKTYVPEEMIPYMQTIQQQIASKVSYPDQARQFGWQGTVKLVLHILNDGTLANASVKESSGYDVFDDNALSMAKSLSPYSAFPPNLKLQDMTVTIPIVYSLNN